MNGIERVKEEHEHELLRKANVLGVGVGLRERGGEMTDEVVISVLVERKVPEDELTEEDLVPARLSQFRTDVVEVGTIRALGQFTDRVRPIVPGYSIGHFAISAGTFGCVVYRDGEPRILSNSHVLALSGAGEAGDAILQPGPHDGGHRDDKVGELEIFSNVKVGTVSCPTASRVAAILNGVARAVGSSHRLRAHDTEPGPESMNRIDAALAIPTTEFDPQIPEIGRPGPVVDAAIGDAVHKTGRTTGYTEGTVTQRHVTVRVEYPRGIAWFEDQDVVVSTEQEAPMSQPGDSGSVILREERPVGLLFAGSSTHTVANPSRYVVVGMGVTFVPTG